MFAMVEDFTVFTHLSSLGVKKASYCPRPAAIEIVEIVVQHKVVLLTWKEFHIRNSFI